MKRIPITERAKITDILCPAAARSMRGVKARTNFVYPSHETSLLSAAAALAAPYRNLQHSAQHQQVDVIAQETLGEVLMLSTAKNSHNYDWGNTQLSFDEPSRKLFNVQATQKQPMVGYKLPGHGCRYVDRKIQPASQLTCLPNTLHSNLQDQRAAILTSSLINDVEVDGFRISPGKQEQWHCVPGEHQQFRLDQFKRSPIVNSELFVSRFCAAVSQPFQVRHILHFQTGNLYVVFKAL